MYSALKNLSDQFAENIWESTSYGAFVFDKDYQLIFWNSVMERITGLSKNESIGKNVLSLFKFITEPKDLSQLADVLKGQTLQVSGRGYQVPSKGIDGFYDGYFSPLLSEVGDIVGGIGMFMDVTEQKRLHRALEESRHTLKAISQIAPDGIFTCRLNGEIISMNEAASKMFDYPVKDLENKNIFNLCKGLDFSDEGRTVELLGLRRNGSSVPIEVRSTVWQIDGQKLFTCVVRDLTLIKHLEEKVSENEDYVDALLEAQSQLGEGVIIRSADSKKLLYCNSAFCKMVGYSTEELMAFPSGLSVVVPEEQEWMAQRIKRRAQNPRVSEFYEVTLLRKDGTRLYADIASQLIETNHGLSSIVLVRDITQKKETIEAIRKSERSNRVLIESSRDIILTLNLEGEIQSVNPAFDTITKLNGVSFIGRSFFDLICEENVQAFNSDFGIVRNRLVNKVGELVIIGEGGRKIICEISLTPLLDCSRISSIMVNMRDITEKVGQLRAIEEEKLRFEVLADSAFEGVALTENGKLLKCNRVFADLFGYLKEELVGKSPMDLIAPEDVVLVEERQKLSQYEPYLFKGKKKDGTWFNAYALGRMVELNGRLIRVTTIKKGEVSNG